MKKIFLILSTFLSSFAFAQNSPVNILSLDGGGIRGVYEITILEQMEKDLGMPISEIFDLAVGTSTGGLLVLGLSVPDKNGYPKYPASLIKKLYTERGKDVFTRDAFHRIKTLNGLLGPKYQSEGLKKTIFEYFGHTKISEALMPVIVTGYHVMGQTGVELSSEDAILYPEDKECYMRDAAYVTSAAPTFFAPGKVSFPWGDLEDVVDGGLYVNNPAMVAYINAKKMYPGRPINIYAVGTGHITVEELSAQLTGRGMLGWISPLVNHVRISSSEHVNDTLHKLLNEDNDPNTNFFRINASLEGGNLKMDDYSKKNVAYLESQGRETLRTSIYKAPMNNLRLMLQ